MDLQRRVVVFVTRSNWILLAASSAFGFLLLPVDFALGLLLGGLIVTVNFHLLSRTLKNAFTPPHLTSHNVVLAKYYVRFTASGIIIFVVISGHYVDPLGLFVGLSVVVGSIMLATIGEITRLICKEAG